MIIICPACDTKFLIPAHAITAEGRDVRCAKCSHSWHAYPPNDSPAFASPASLEAEGEENNIATSSGEDFDEEMAERLARSLSGHSAAASGAFSPATHPLWKIGAGALSLGVLFLILLLLREPLYPALGPVYRLVGYYPEAGITLADVSLRELPSRNKKRYEIECSILNQSQETRIIPQLAMQLLNKEKLVLGEDSDFLSTSGTHLLPGKHTPCRNLRFENPFSTADLLVIELGSPLELFLRGPWQEPESASSASASSDASTPADTSPHEDDNG